MPRNPFVLVVMLLILSVTSLSFSACLSRPAVVRPPWRDPRLVELVGCLDSTEYEDCGARQKVTVFGRVAMILSETPDSTVRLVLDDGEYPDTSYRAICLVESSAHRSDLTGLRSFDWVEVQGRAEKGSLPGYVLLVDCTINKRQVFAGWR